MRAFAAIAVLCAAASLAASQTSRAPDATTATAPSDDPIAQLVAGVLAHDAAAESRLAALRVDEGNVDSVKAQLQAGRANQTQVAQVNVALGRAVVERSTPQIIAQVHPLIRAAVERIAYRELPDYKPDELARYKDPVIDTRDALARVQKARDERSAKETAIAEYDKAVWSLGEVYVNMTLMIDDAAQDAALVKWLLARDEKTLADWAIVPEAVKARAPSLKRERAARLFKLLLPVADKLCWQCRDYVDHRRATLKTTDQPSAFETKEAFPGVGLRAAMNILAAVAHEPAINVPTPAQCKGVAAGQWKNFPKGFPRDVPPGH